MNFSSEAALTSFARSLGAFLSSGEYLPITLELVGDVGAGKTTFTRALAAGLGVKAPVTSPSFTISKRYAFPLKPREWSAGAIRETISGATPVKKSSPSGTLIHYDFYRLDDPGLMSSELEEALSEPNSIIVLEWAASVKDLLPESHPVITFSIQEDGSRDLKFSPALKSLLSKMPQAPKE